MTQKRISQIDTETGEIQQGCLVYIPHRPKLKEPFVMTFQDSIEKLAEDREMTQDRLRVLLKIMGRLDFDNYIHITQAEIATQLHMAKANVSRAMTHLTDKGIILRGPKVGRSHTYRLSPTLGWKGRVKNLNDYKKKTLELVVNQAQTGA